MNSYTGTAKVLHWLIALMVLGAISAGFYMTSQALSPQIIKIYMTHKSVGVSIFLLMLARLLWRLKSPPPALPAALPAWQKTVSRLTHLALYLLLFLMPISGYLMNSATGTPMKYFGLFRLPNVIARSADASAFWKAVHGYLAFALCALIALHVLAALKHYFVDRDQILQRMLPNRRKI
jgi:cytochrome b561